MEFGWTAEQRIYWDNVVRFAQDRLNDDDLLRRDHEGTFSRDAWSRCAEFGLQGLPVDEKYGGSGADAITVALALEALGYGCEDGGLVFSLNGHLWSCVEPIHRFGSAEQKQHYLPGLCDGSLIGVQAVTESGAGSDAMSLRTEATKQDGSYVLNGAKSFTTNAPEADVFVVLARTGRTGNSLQDITAFLVDRTLGGLEVGAPERKMGLRTSPMSSVSFSDCRVSDDRIIGREGSGFLVFNASMEAERTFIMASALGVMARQIERCVEHARTRQQFGRPLAEFQAVSHRIADMRVRLQAARLLVYEAAWRFGEGRTEPSLQKDSSPGLHAALAKLFVSESFVQSSLDALQVHGASAYMTGLEFERDVRDAVGARLYSGTSEMQRNVVARCLGL